MLKHFEFYKRMVGNWTSDRTKYFPEQGRILRKSIEIEIFTMGDDVVRIESPTSTVDLLFRREPKFVKSTHGIDELAHIDVLDINPNEMRTHLLYEGIEYLEHYKILDDDLRTRNLVGKENDKIVIIANYIEYRNE